MDERGLSGLSMKIVFLEKKVPKWSIETHTRLIREVQKAQIRLNILISLKGIKGIKYKNLISWKESVKVGSRNSF